MGLGRAVAVYGEGDGREVSGVWQKRGGVAPGPTGPGLRPWL